MGKNKTNTKTNKKPHAFHPTCIPLTSSHKNSPTYWRDTHCGCRQVKTRQYFLCKLAEGAFYVPAPFPSLCHSQPCLSPWLQPRRAEPFPVSLSQVQTGATSCCSPESLTLNSRKHAEPCLSEKETLKHIPSFATLSPASKYCSLHLYLIGISLGIHCLYLLLVSPYQQMPTYLILRTW